MKDRKRYFLLGILAAILLCGCAPKNVEETPESMAAEDQAAPVGEESPESDAVTFEGQDMEGNAISSEIFAASRLTMINVWATYCNPCLREMPELGELAREYDAEDFQLLGIVSDVMEGQDEEDLEFAASLIEETGADYPHLLLNESLYQGLLMNVTAVPTTFFLDKDGVVLDVVVGAMDKSAWKEKIDGLLEEL